MRNALRTLAVAAAITGGLILAPMSASATDHGVDMNRACQITTMHINAWAYLNQPATAYTWRCGPVAVGVNVQAYCNSDFPGTVATVLDPANPYSWRCRG